MLTLGYEKDGLTVEPAIKYNVDRQEASPILSLSQKNGADTLKASYDINGEHGSLEWNHMPYKVTLKIIGQLGKDTWLFAKENNRHAVGL